MLDKCRFATPLVKTVRQDPYKSIGFKKIENIYQPHKVQQCLNPAIWGIQGRNGNEKRSKKWFLFVYLFFCILNIQKPAGTLSAILAWTNSLTHSPSCSLSPPLSLKEAAFCDLQIEADHVTSGRFVNQERGGSWGWNCLKGKAALFHSLSFVKRCYLILSAYTHWMWKWQQHKGNRWTKYKTFIGL